LVGAWVVLQIIDFIVDAISAPNWVVQVFILVAAIGLPVVLAISWAFELTPGGVKRESEIDRSQSIAATTGRRLDRIIIVFLTMAVVFLVGERLMRSPVEMPPSIEGTSEPHDITARKNTIAVLPFVNMSSDQEQEYFSDGITEEILNRLAGIRELRVAARTSVFSFKDHNEDIREIARKLGVETILEGSVRRSGDEIRITAQLIRASDGFHLWSNAYDRKLENIFAIQDDIATRIAEALQISMGISGRQVEAPRTIDPEVYDLYLRARALHRQRGEVLLDAIDLFEQALEMRLHLSDEVVRRRMIQVMEQLIVASNPPAAPTDEEILAAFKTRSVELERPPRYSLQHLYFNRERESDVPSIARRIRDGAMTPQQALPLSSPFLHGYSFRHQTPEQLARIFGAVFVDKLAGESMAPGVWIGPLRSAFGWHLVWLDEVSPARPARLEEVREQLARDLVQQARNHALRAGIDRLAAQYEFRL